jgi:hypothetical protein
MNNFEKTFFKKYIPEWQEVKQVFHRQHTWRFMNNLTPIQKAKKLGV